MCNYMITSSAHLVFHKPLVDVERYPAKSIKSAASYQHIIAHIIVYFFLCCSYSFFNPFASLGRGFEISGKPILLDQFSHGTIILTPSSFMFNITLHSVNGMDT